jgi:hypothetical protein
MSMIIDKAAARAMFVICEVSFVMRKRNVLVRFDI